jgi:hypothetical protein
MLIYLRVSGRALRRTETEAILDQLSYEDFVRAHNLAPLVDIKTACRVVNVGHSRFYELVKDGAFVLIANGSRRNVTAKDLHQHYLGLIDAARRQ